MKINNIIVLVLMCCGLYMSCSKTNYDQETRPYTDIVSFYVEDQVAGKQKLQGVISGDSIIIYWNPETTQPSNIVPTIKLAEGAKISPESGTSVAFSDQTKYTVTAENGQTKEYTLRIKTNREQPVLTAIVTSLDLIYPMEETFWSVTPATQPTSQVHLNLLGEYFLTTGNLEDVKVYMQRLHDGYEFDLSFDAESVTNTSMKVELPKFSNQLDTGRHRIWVQVGDLKSESKDIFMRGPNVQQYGKVSGQFKERGQSVHAGQTVTIDYNYSDELDGAVTRYFKPSDLHTVMISARRLERVDTTINPRTGREQYTNVYKDEAFMITDFQATANQVSFKLPDGLEGFVGGNLRVGQFLYKFINSDGVWTHLSDGGANRYGQIVLFNNSLFYAPDPQTGRLTVETKIVSSNGK